MKAVVLFEHGGPEVLQYLEDWPIPEIGHNEVLVQVKACALNNVDVQVRAGLPRVRVPLPQILGHDIAGIVAGVGDAVEGIEVGSPVVVSPVVSCGLCQLCLSGNDQSCRSQHLINGGFAAYVAVPAVNIVPLQGNLSFEEAASLPVVFLTAWHMLVTRAHVMPGEDVLVQAAGSGVGIAAIQVAKLFGARVIATASTEAKLQKAQELGADATINYATSDLYEEVRKIVGPKGVEVVIEHVGATVFEQSIRLLTAGGRLVTCGATAGPEVHIDVRYLFSRHLSLLGSRMGSKAEFLEMIKFVWTGRLRPVVHAILPLREAPQAHRMMMNREQFGKIVLVP